MSEGAKEEEQAEGGDRPAGKVSPRDPEWRAAALFQSVLRAQGELFVLVTLLKLAGSVLQGIIKRLSLSSQEQDPRVGDAISEILGAAQSVLKDYIEPATDKLFTVVDFPPAGKVRQEAMR
jgi:hypothetical protein